MSSLLTKPRTLVLKAYWLLGAALVMGGAILCTHFLTILSFIHLANLSFSIYWLTIAIVLAITLPGIAWTIYMIKTPSVKYYLLITTIFTSAVLSVYYIGMKSINNVNIHYDSDLSIIAASIAFIGSFLAVCLSSWSEKGSFRKRLFLRWGSSLSMGFAVCGMNIVGMLSSNFTPHLQQTHYLSIEPFGLYGIVFATVLNIIMLSLLIYSSKSISDIAVKLKADFLHAILKTMKGGVVACDAQGHITLINPTVTEMFGVKLGRLRSLGDPNPAPKGNVLEAIEFLEKPLAKVLGGEEVKDVEVLTHDCKGAPHTLLVDGQQIKGYNDENLGAVIVFSDISKRKIDEQELRFRATHDTLTGLPNRTLLLDRLNFAINSANRRNCKVAIIFIDLDNFKFINDALGHSVGDALLKMVATRFANLMRTTDTLARIGGDEFVIVLPDLDNTDEIPALLSRILQGISKPYIIEKHTLNITCSIGFSLYPDHGADVDTLLKNADNAMYQAKDSGKNTFQHYSKSMQTRVRKRLEIENGLREALHNEQFILEYQPKLDIKKNQLAGIEALVRWEHPTKGIIEPNDFISIAEDTGLIVPLSKWVLKTACAQNKAWQDAGITPVCIAVNVSSRQFKDKNFLEILKSTLSETGLEAKYLELELTETTAMSNPEEFIKILTQFKKLGVITSIDDFGTGYSSLNYLRQFSVNALKIDQSFIKEMESKGDDVSIVKAIVSLGHSLNMKVLAEGVETNEQLKQLLENDCDQVQGFYVSRPLSAEEMGEFMKEYRNLIPVNKKEIEKQLRKKG
jgi:diguanylate cyclase (GGDEF)-like protein/PAS domain S-box-containing protein